jgi:hypothetical protein
VTRLVGTVWYGTVGMVMVGTVNCTGTALVR